MSHIVRRSDLVSFFSSQPALIAPFVRACLDQAQVRAAEAQAAAAQRGGPLAASWAGHAQTSLRCGGAALRLSARGVVRAAWLAADTLDAVQWAAVCAAQVPAQPEIPVSDVVGILARLQG